MGEKRACRAGVDLPRSLKERPRPCVTGAVDLLLPWHAVSPPDPRGPRDRLSLPVPVRLMHAGRSWPG